MLILTRKEGDKIIFGQKLITVKILDVSHDDQEVRIGIEAPPEFSIHREEIYERIEKDQS